MSQFTTESQNPFRRIFNRAIQLKVTAAPLPEPDAPLANLYTFTQSTEGSGSFGEWIIDGHGLPAYDYTMAQHTDPIAEYNTSQGKRRDHWHQIGNKHITGIVSNDGYCAGLSW